MALNSPTTSIVQGSPMMGSITEPQWFHGSRIVGYSRSLYCAPQGTMIPCVFSALLGISVTELQGGSVYTTVQACPRRTVPSVEMIGLGAFDVSGGIHQTIGRVRWDRHNATEIVHKEAIGMPLAGIVPVLESIPCLLEVDLYVLDEVVDLAGAV